MTGAVPAAAGEPVEDYLDQLLLTLGGPPRQVRNTLAEVEAHLRDAVAEGIAAGLAEHEAQAAAVQRIGPLHGVTGRGALVSRPATALAHRSALAVSLVAGVALVAIGFSGAMAWALARIGGGTFVAAPWAPGTYTSADCARWLASDPAARTCAAAMTYDHVGDTVLNSLAAGVLGLLVLLAYRLLRRRWQDRASLTALPVTSAEAAGAILACVAAVVTFGQAVDLETVQHGLGAGWHFSLAAAAAGAAALFGVRLWRAVRLRPA